MAELIKLRTERFLGKIFESSCYNTPDFHSFYRAWQSDIKKIIAPFGWNVVTWIKGHFEASAFLSKEVNGELKFIYVSISDVRFFRDDWFNRMLVRYASRDRDFLGGGNYFCCMVDLPDYIRMITGE